MKRCHNIVGTIFVCWLQSTRPSGTCAVHISSHDGGRRGRNEPLMRDFHPRSERRGLQLDDGAGRREYKARGDDSCPCLDASQLASRPPVPNEQAEAELGRGINLTTYGLNCAPHDTQSAVCLSANNCSNVVPLPPDCERSHCVRSWCYVDPDNCLVVNKPSWYLGPGRHYSYATCGFMDSFTHADRLSELRGSSLRVAFNSNSGGWQGAYNREGSFAVNHDWEGPIVEFVQRAALQAGFQMKITKPPEWLRDESKNFFGSSSFDYCVYTASLGYIDLCVAAYTITDKRASVATFFETSADPVYLVTFQTEAKTSWDTFVQSFLTIFQPFTPGSWLMILLFCLPTLGLLMLFHEYGAPGSAYPRTVPTVIRNIRDNGRQYKTRKVRMIRHVIRSLYMAFLAFFQESYDQAVVTPGGKANLLAISSFVLLVLAVYTANLAAILTSDISTASVSSVEEAIIAGYNFCSERKVAEIVMGVHNVPESVIVPDPVAIGGDGRPGFNCPECNARSRVFDYMRLSHNDGSMYCNAAFASWEDLQVLHSRAKHCDKQRVGDPLAHQNIGIPLSDKWSGSLLAMFHRVRNEGVWEMELSAAEPEQNCPVREGEGNALSVRELTGIWMISFSFAFIALIIKLVHHCQRKKAKEAKEKVEEPLQHYDQWGNPTSHEVFVDGRTYHPDSVRELAKTLEKGSATSRHLMSSSANLMPRISEEDNFEIDGDGTGGKAYGDNGTRDFVTEGGFGGLKISEKNPWPRLRRKGKGSDPQLGELSPCAGIRDVDGGEDATESSV